MKKTWKLAMICMAIASASLMAGCGDDNNPDNPEEGEIDNPVVSNPEEPDGSLQEPEKAKAKINEVGKELVSMVNANDFKDLATIADALSALSDEPYYGYENADYQHRASNLIAATRGDMGALYALSRTTYQASEYYGTYEYDTKEREWVWTEGTPSDKFICRFPAENEIVEVTVESKGGETDFNIDGDTYKIPAEVNGNIVWKGKTLATANVKTSNLKNTAPYEADVNAEVKVGDKYVVTAQVSVKDKVATAYSEVNIDGKKAVIGKGVINGQNMTSDSEEISFEERFNNAEAQAILLDDAYITMKCSDVKSLSQRLDEDEYTYPQIPENATKEEAIKIYKDFNTQQKADAEALATDISKYLTGDVRFVSQTNPSANLGFQGYIDYSYEAYWWNESTENSEPLGIDVEYWETEPVAVFNDGSKMSFDNLDGENSPFRGFIDSLEDLIDAFSKLVE